MFKKSVQDMKGKLKLGKFKKVIKLMNFIVAIKENSFQKRKPNTKQNALS